MAKNYVQKLNNEYIEILQEGNAASKNFWDLEKIIFEDKESIGIFGDMRRSTIRQNILALLRDEIIIFDDLNDFSEELMSDIKYI